MKKLKKIAALTLCLLLIGVCAALGACENNDNSSGKDKNPGVDLPEIPFSVTLDPANLS